MSKICSMAITIRFISLLNFVKEIKFTADKYKQILWGEN